MQLLFTLLAAGLAAAAPLADRSIHPIEERQLPAGDPCGRLVGTTPCESRLFSKRPYAADPSDYSPQTILACMRTISFKPAVRENIMNVATTMYNSLDILAANQLGDSEASQNQGVDIQAECKYSEARKDLLFAESPVRRINGSTYLSDFDFQYDLARSLQLLNDGHHAWSSCYRSLFTTTHAIPIVSLSASADSTTPNIFVVPDVANFVSDAGFTTLYSNAGIDVAGLAGAQVVSIEGKPAWDYLEQDKLPVTGVYTDRQQRLNSVFASYQSEGGRWSRIPGRFTSTRDWSKNNLTMTVQTAAGATREIVIPWVVRWNGRSNWSYSTGEGL